MLLHQQPPVLLVLTRAEPVVSHLFFFSSLCRFPVRSAYHFESVASQIKSDIVNVGRDLYWIFGLTYPSRSLLMSNLITV
jgi:hypothetical protein